MYAPQLPQPNLQPLISASSESLHPDRTRPEWNQIRAVDRIAHDWYRFVLSYPPHLVQEYVTKFGIGPGQRVLDPFCGTGTTVVECKKLGIVSVGVEANPLAHFAGSTKLDWSPDPDGLLDWAQQIADRATALIELETVWRSLPEDNLKILLKNSLSPLPTHKVLILREQIEQVIAPPAAQPYRDHLWLALAKALVNGISNIYFGPEVTVGKAKDDAPVVQLWLSAVQAIAADLRHLQTLPTADGQPVAPGIAGGCTQFDRCGDYVAALSE
jgi:hypothetical protein